MDIQENTKSKSNSLPTRFVIVSLLACLLCIIVLAIGTVKHDGVLHQIMSNWYGPYIIISVCFPVTFFIAQLLGFDMRVKKTKPENNS